MSPSLASSASPSMRVFERPSQHGSAGRRESHYDGPFPPPPENSSSRALKRGSSRMNSKSGSRGAKSAVWSFFFRAVLRSVRAAIGAPATRLDPGG